MLVGVSSSQFAAEDDAIRAAVVFHDLYEA